MKYIYLDWNVFNKIENKNNLFENEQLTFSQIEKLILDSQIICPYSNAHINDLLRGHAKNATYIPGHLEILKRLTNNLCIVQYWGSIHATWHYRDINAFFDSALADKGITAKSFSELLDFDETGLWQKQLDFLKAMPVPKEFKQLYTADPIFNLIYPKTKVEMNVLALCEDIYDFSNNAKKDYLLYKSLRRYVVEGMAKLKNQQKMLKDINKSITELPAYLTNDGAWEKYSGKTKTSENEAYQKIINTYCKIDFRGYKSDEQFSNLIDDALHVFYGAHCDYFVTIDDRCHYKAIETYHQLGIITKVVKPNEFIQCYQLV